ncbi:MAG: hypothetical protein ACIAXF_01530 [Phycisphaerales bacterium JB063]
MSRALIIVLVVVGSMAGGLAVAAVGMRVLPGQTAAASSTPAAGNTGDGHALQEVSSEPEADDWADWEEEPLSPREIEEWVTETLEDLGHPDDPTLPRGVLGSSDEVIAAMDPFEAKMLLEDRDIQDFLNRHTNDHRYAFALGRLAMFHGYTTLAERLLVAAKDAGSGAAAAYLADPAFTSSDDAAAQLLRQAAGLNFAPAAGWLADLESEQAGPGPSALAGSVPFRFEDYDRPEIIRAFYEGRAPEGMSELETWGYISSLLAGISDSSNVFMVEDARAFFLELSPQLQVNAEIAMATSAGALDESLDMTLAQFMGMLNGLQGGGSSIGGTAAQINRNMMAPQEALLMARASGQYDGRRLALSYDYHTEEFRRIYAGVKKYVESRR